MTELPGWVVDAAWLQANRAGVAVADVRWYLDGRSGSDAFEAGHLPGAVFVDLDHDLSEHGDPTAGRHPLPSPAAFAGALSRLGLGPDRPVVAYDDSGGGTAGRLVVMLRVLGRPAALLDGGLAAWPAPLERGPAPVPVPAEVPVVPWPEGAFATVADLHAAGTALFDVRSPERYRGDVEPVDPRAGHIPGARNLPWTSLLDGSGRFLPPDELAARFRHEGIAGPEVVASCGSGVSACSLLVALHHAGLGGGRLFVPSWSGWSADLQRPVATGAEPGHAP